VQAGTAPYLTGRNQDLAAGEQRRRNSLVLGPAAGYIAPVVARQGAHVDAGDPVNEFGAVRRCQPGTSAHDRSRPLNVTSGLQ